MDAKKFVTDFAMQFDETDASYFSLDTKFKDIEEWSSLVALSVIAMVDEEYSVRLNGDEIRASETINDLFGIIRAKVL